jgi:histidyl-tRNA synthetase
VLVGDDERAAGTVTLRDLRGETGQLSVARASLTDELRSLLP